MSQTAEQKIAQLFNEIKKKQNKVKTGMYLDEDLYEGLKTLSAASGRSINEILVMMITKFLAE